MLSTYSVFINEMSNLLILLQTVEKNKNQIKGTFLWDSTIKPPREQNAPAAHMELHPAASTDFLLPRHPLSPHVHLMYIDSASN